MSRVFVYCRVSTNLQTVENQLQDIEKAGFNVTTQRTVTETVSGSVAATQRKGFSLLLQKLESGDVLVVTKLDRLGRNAMDVRATVEHLTEMGVSVHCLQLGGADLTSSAGKMIMTVLVAMSEFEKDLLIERTLSGQARARAEGRVGGRPSALTPEQKEKVLERIAKGEAIAAIARDYMTTRQTIMRVRSAVKRPL